MRRLLIVSGVAVILIGVGVGVYFIFFANQGSVVVAPPSGSLPDAGTLPPPTGGEEPQTIEISQPQKVAERLVQISKGPVVAGAVAYQASSTESAADTAVNFVARESGNIYQYLVRAGTLTRLSNKTIPGIQEALWRPDGSLVFVRYLSGDTENTINTYALPASGEGGYFLAQNIVSFAVNAANILTLASGTNGSVGTVSRPDGSQTRQAFTTPLASLHTQFFGTSQYLAYTKPSGGLPGYAYLINSTGNVERLAGPLGGLMALPSPSGKWLLVSHTLGGKMHLALLNVATRDLTPLPLATIALKCAWVLDEKAAYCGVPKNAPTGVVYPDDWLAGAVAFSDRIWRIDVTGRFAELALDFEKETDQALDAVALTIDPKGTLLVFKNKNDSSLWSYEL